MRILVACAALVLTASTTMAEIPAMPDLDKAIASGEIQTESQHKKNTAALERRLVLEHYAAQGLSEEETIERYAPLVYIAARIGGGAYDRDLQAALDAEESPEHEDPFYRFNGVLGLMQDRTPTLEDAAALRRAIDDMHGVAYSPLRIAGASVNYYEEMRDLLDTDSEEFVEAEHYTFTRIAQAAAAESVDTTFRRYLWTKYIKSYVDDDNPKRPLRALRVFEGTDGVDPWFLHMIRGEISRKAAWESRGSDWAYETSDEQFARFHSGLDNAMREFERAYAIDPMCPETAHRMVMCLYPRGSTWDAAGWAWVERCLIANVEFEGLFDTLHYALLPKWQGSIDSLSDFAIWCNKENLYHTDLPYQSLYTMSRVLKYYGLDLGDKELFWVMEKDLVDAVIGALEGLNKHNTNYTNDYRDTALGYLYYRGKGDRERAAECIRKCAETGLNDDALGKLHAGDTPLDAWVLPFVGATSEIAEKAVRAETEGDFDKSILAWEEAIVLLDEADDQMGLRAVRHQKQRVLWKRDYELGRWVSLGFDNSMTGWNDHEGLWTRIDEGSVRGARRGTPNESVLVADIEPGESFEFEADCRFVGETGPYGALALVYHRGPRRTDGWEMHRNISAQIGRGFGAIGWFFGHSDYNIPIPESDDGWYHLRIIVEGDQCRGYINDEPIGRGEVPNVKPGRNPLQMRVGLGAWAADKGTAEFTNIRIRKHIPPVDLEF